MMICKMFPSEDYEIVVETFDHSKFKNSPQIVEQTNKLTLLQNFGD